MSRRWLQRPLLRSVAINDERRATWMELFFDLVFVVAVAELATYLEHDASIEGFFKFSALVVPVWWVWVGATFYATRFDTDDLVRRILLAVQIFAVVALAVNVHDAFGSTSTGFTLAYVGVRSILILEYILAGANIPEARPLTTRYASGFALSALLWLVSLALPEPYRFVVWGLAMVVDVGTPSTAGSLHARLAPSAKHLPERFGLFIIIVLGESIVGVASGIASEETALAAGIAGALGLLIAMGFWWSYFDDYEEMSVQSVQDGGIRLYQIWLYTHLPLVVGLIATGVGVALVVASEPSAALASADRWLICAAVALSLCCLGLLQFARATARQSVESRFMSMSYLPGGALVALLIGLLGSGMLPLTVISLLATLCVFLVVIDIIEDAREDTQA